MKKFLLVALAAIFSLSVSAQATQTAKVSAKDNTVAQVVIQTNGTCQKCADCFKENVPFFKGVKTYSYDIKTAKLTINYDAATTNPDQLRKQISKLGYNADNVEADAAARAKLPACCRGEKSCSEQPAAGAKACSGQCKEHKDGAKACSGQCKEHKDGAKACSGQCKEHKDGAKACSGQCKEHKDGAKACSGQCKEHKDGAKACSGQCQGHKDGKCSGTCQGKDKATK